MKASDLIARGIKPAKLGPQRISPSAFSPDSVSRFQIETPRFQDQLDLLVSRPSPDQLLVVVQPPSAERRIGKAFLYAAKPLADEDFDRTPSGQRVVTIRSARFILEEQLDPNWYTVRCE